MRYNTTEMQWCKCNTSIEYVSAISNVDLSDLQASQLPIKDSELGCCRLYVVCHLTTGIIRFLASSAGTQLLSYLSNSSYFVVHLLQQAS